MSATRFCTQCWRDKPAKMFVGKKGGYVNWCSTCRRAYRSGKPRRAGRRIGLKSSKLRVTFVRSSLSMKLGGIAASITSGSTCPPSCSFFGKGCYAEFNLLRAHWNRTAREGLTWDAFLSEVRELDPGELWRHNQAGDLPGLGDTLDTALLDELVDANRGKSGFTFTHKPLRSRSERAAVKRANASGFTINLSADSLEHADRLAKKRIGPVAVVLPSDSPTRGVRTPGGRPVAVCPAQTHGLTCSECRLCARPDRAGIVGFLAHGQAKRDVSELVQLRRRPVA